MTNKYGIIFSIIIISLIILYTNPFRENVYSSKDGSYDDRAKDKIIQPVEAEKVGKHYKNFKYKFELDLPINWYEWSRENIDDFLSKESYYYDDGRVLFQVSKYSPTKNKKTYNPIINATVVNLNVDDCEAVVDCAEPVFRKIYKKNARKYEIAEEPIIFDFKNKEAVRYTFVEKKKIKGKTIYVYITQIVFIHNDKVILFTSTYDNKKNFNQIQYSLNTLNFIEKESIPQEIDAATFNKQIVEKLNNENYKKAILSYYKLDRKNAIYVLKPNVSNDDKKIIRIIFDSVNFNY